MLTAFIMQAQASIGAPPLAAAVGAGCFLVTAVLTVWLFRVRGDGPEDAAARTGEVGEQSPETLSPDEPAWWPEFERQFAAYVTAVGVFPRLRIDVMGMRTLVGSRMSGTDVFPLRALRVRVTSMEAERSAALTFRLYFTADESEALEGVVWGPPVDDFDFPSPVELDQLPDPVNVAHETTVGGDLLFQESLFPLDTSTPGWLEVRDHISGKRVRMPADTGTYDRNTWAPERRRGRLIAWWCNMLEREDRILGNGRYR